jgi:uncharacterized protein (TIGR02145 family)
MIIKFLPLLLLPLLGMGQTNANGGMPLGGNTSSEKQPLEIKRNALFNLEELKVRWKKAALENCPGVPCLAVTAPGAPTGVVATVGNTSVSVAFVAPTNNGGRAITSYTVTTNPATSPVTGTTSPINVTELTNGAAYTFTVIATNEVGNSVSSSASTAVTAFTCGTSSVPDYDGNAYNTVLIGAQCWMVQNLKVTKYNDGTAIDLDASGTMPYYSSDTWRDKLTGAYTIHFNDLSTGTYAMNYGYLYNWYAAKGITTLGSTTYKNLCPTGYHVPTDSDWNKLVKFIDLGTDTSTIRNNTWTQNFSVGTEMKSTSTLWNVGTPPSTNTSGFSALPGGYRSLYGGFTEVGYSAFFWSANACEIPDPINSWGRKLYHYSGFVERTQADRNEGASVRCLRN